MGNNKIGEIIKLGLILFVLTAVSAFALGITNNITQVVIQEKAHLANVEAIKALLPEAEEFEKIEDADVVGRNLIVEVYEGSKGGNVVGYTIKTNPSGYGGRVEVLMGISKDGEIVGLKIGEHSETPGLGSKIADASFINQFIGKNASVEFKTTKGGEQGDEYIQAITSATVSSDAVTVGVNGGRSLFNDILKNR